MKLLIILLLILFLLPAFVQAQKRDSILYESGQSNVWHKSRKNIITYSADGLSSNELIFHWNSASSVWEKNGNWSRQCNADSTLRETSYSFWENGILRIRDKGISQYSLHNGKLKMDQHTQLNWKNNSWQNYSFHFCDYDSNSYLKRNTLQLWDTLTLSWKNNWMNSFVYRPDGQIGEIYTLDWDSTNKVWLNFHKYEHIFDSTGENDSDYMYEWTAGSWLKVGKADITNINGLLQSNIYSRLISGIWQLSSRQTIIYDSLDRRYQEIIENWDKNANNWRYTSRQTNYYQKGPGTKNAEIYESTGTAVYPNPCNERLAVSLDDESPAHITLYNSNGQLVKQFHSTESSIEINVQDLSAGIYFLCVTQNNRRYVSKIFRH